MTLDRSPTRIPQGRRAVLGLAAALAALARAGGAAAQAPGATPIPIGIIGSGNIGSTVGSLWLRAGHPVLFSSRHPEALKPLTDGLGPLARAGTPDEAAAFGPVVFLAVPYGAMPALGQQYAAALRGKIILDATNAVPARDGETATAARERGIGINSASYFPGARLVRAFNSLGYRIFAEQAHRPAPALAIPIAGDDAEAMRVAAALVRDAGFDPVEVGPLARASDFAIGAVGFGQQLPAAELRQRLGLAP